MCVLNCKGCTEWFDNILCTVASIIYLTEGSSYFTTIALPPLEAYHVETHVIPML